MTTRELLRQATSLLIKAGCQSPRLDAELLLMHAWKTDKTALIIRMDESVPAHINNEFQSLLSRRQQREPIAYILGEKEFWSHMFMVDSSVLIPRPETEHLIEQVLKYFPDKNGKYRFCDIGTGSGCIACALASEFPNAEIIATDISESALKIANTNAENLHLGNRVTFRHGDMFTALGKKTTPFDAIISNPPYVSRNEMETLEAELAYEPHSALSDEQDGLHFLSILLDQCKHWLKPGGYLIMETGLCGLPETTPHLHLLEEYDDLAGIKRGGVYRLMSG